MLYVQVKRLGLRFWQWCNSQFWSSGTWFCTSW